MFMLCHVVTRCNGGSWQLEIDTLEALKNIEIRLDTVLFLITKEAQTKSSN